METQTSLSYGQIIERETIIEFKEKEIELTKFKIKEELEQKERSLLRKERDLEIRERLIEEKKQEYTYKQKEINQRIKQQISWPLDCLENE